MQQGSMLQFTQSVSNFVCSTHLPFKQLWVYLHQTRSL